MSFTLHPSPFSTRPSPFALPTCSGLYNDPMTPRRWFRFSLRTFFIVVAIFAVFTAWVVRELAIVRERRAVLAWLEGQVYANDGGHWEYQWDDKRVTWWHRLLGEENALTGLSYPPRFTSAELERVQAAFPEATATPWSAEPEPLGPLGPAQHATAPITGIRYDVHSLGRRVLNCNAGQIVRPPFPFASFAKPNRISAVGVP